MRFRKSSKHHEDQLRTTAGRLQIVMDHLSIVVFELDAAGTFLLSRGQGLAKLGLKPDQVVGVSIRDLYRNNPDILEAFSTACTGRSVNIETPVNDCIWSANFIPLTGNNGQVERVFGTAIDITEWKRAEVAVRASEARWHTLFDNSPISLWEEDFSGIRKRVEELRGLGITDIGRHCDEHPEELRRIAATVRVIDVNRATLELYNAGGKEEFLRTSTSLFPADADRSLRETVLTIAEGRHRLVGVETINHKESGEEIFASLSWIVAPGYEATYDKVIVSIVDLTQRRHAEEALQRESELLHALMDNMPDTIYFKDLESRFIRINRAMSVAFGLQEPEQAIGKTDADFFDHAHSFETLEDERRIMETGEPLLGKIEHVRRTGGRYRSLLTTKVPVRNSRGEVVGLVGSSRDITELQQAEQLEEALYRIVETSNSATDLLELYAAIHRIIGGLMPAGNFYIAEYDSERQIITFPYFVDEVDPPPEPVLAGTGLTSYVLRSGKSMLATAEEFDELRLRGDVALVGSPSPIWLGVPLISGSRTIGAMVVQHYSDPNAYTERELHILEYISTHIARMIEYKRGEEAIRRSEGKYRLLFEESQDAIVLSTPDGKLVDVNPAAVRLFGFESRAELLEGVCAEDLYQDPKDRDVFRELLEQDGSVNELEVAIRRKNGEIRIVTESATAIREQNGRTTGYRVYLRDITERKRLEEQLMQAQKMEGIGTLAGGIAHDFNNLLGIILGYTSLLGAPAVDDKHRLQSVETIKKAVQRGANLVRQLLTFARKSDPSLKPLGLNELAGDLVRLLVETFPRTIAITTELSPGLPDIIADHNQVHQAVFNLCVNARDAILDESMQNPGIGSIVVKTEIVEGSVLLQRYSDATAGRYIALSVRDTGIGMDEQTRERIFEPFFTTKALGKGTGLGLAVVYGVMNSHHGYVDVQSTRGGGSTFRIYFPVPAEPKATEPEVPDLTARGGECILLVEDEELLLSLLQTVMEAAGFRTLLAHDGQEGLDLYRQNRHDIACVLSDMGLPRLGGWEMFLKMREINPNVKAILASGYFNPNLKMDMLKAGAKDFIQKPYIADAIVSRIREVIAGQ